MQLRSLISSNGNLRRHLLPVAAYAVITVVMAGPFVSLTNLGGSVLYHGDPGLVMWAISWVNHALLTQPQDVFAANVFYPSAGSLSFSDHAFGIALLVQPWFWFSEDPFVPYNVLFLFSYFASAVGMYFLCLYYTKNRLAAFVGGLIFGFCFFRAHHFGHLTLIANQWFPFVILLFHKLRERFHWKLAGLWIVLFVLQCLTNWYNAAFIVIILAWVMGSDFIQNRWDWRSSKRFALCAFLAALFILPFYLPYSRIAKPADYAENKAFAADLGSYLEPPLNTFVGRRLDNTDRWIWGERSNFVGYVPLALALAGVLLWRKRALAWTYASLALAGFVLSLGPESLDFPGWKLPAPFVYALLPPLAQLRATARFAIIVMFCVSVLTAMALARMPKSRWWIVPISLVILFEYYPIGLGWDPVTAPAFKPRPVDVWLRQHNVPQSGPPGWRRPKQRDRKAVLELPDYSASPEWYYESLYMLYSTHHWMNLVNGYTRFYPQDYGSNFQLYSQFPSEASIQFMKEKGIDYVVVHGDKYEAQRRPALESHPLLVARLGEDWVYEIR